MTPRLVIVPAPGETRRTTTGSVSEFGGPANGRRHDVAQVSQRDGLSDASGRARHERRAGQRSVARAGQHEDRDLRMVPVNAPEHLQPFYPWQRDVEKDDVSRILANAIELCS